MSTATYIAPDGLSLARKFAAAEGTTIDLLRGQGRHMTLTRARQAVIWRLAKETTLSLPEIGAIVGKDHTSVLHAIRAENERRGEAVRGARFPSGYRERLLLGARIYNELSREVRL